jgi:putative hemolysin
MPHIVDTLVEERAADLIRRPLLWRCLKPVVYPIIGHKRAKQVIDEVAELSGIEIFKYTAERIQMDVQIDGLEQIPRQGGAIITPNHPVGMADGIAMYDALKSVRDDLTFFANRDAVRAAPGLKDVIIPVEWVDENRTHERRRETVKSMVRAFRDQRLVVLFPSGRLAQPTLRGLKERPWESTALNLATKYEIPVIPMHIKARNSWMYYLFYFLHEELRDMTLFRELFNKQNAKYRITVGNPFRSMELEGAEDIDLEQMTVRLRQFVAEEMPAGAREFKL